MDDVEFHSHFRMKKETFNIVADMMNSYRYTNKGLDYRQKTLIGLWFVSNHSTYRLISQQFGIALSTAYDTIIDFIDMLVQNRNKFISLPTEDQLPLNAQRFGKYGFPNVYGALDGTTINVMVPDSHKIDYMGRKHTTGINLTALCDANKKLLNITTGCSARCHDSHIFQCSKLGAFVYNGGIPRKYHIVGDAAYGLHMNIMVPYAGIDLDPPKETFNKRHSSTRMVVERTFSDIKTRFLRLTYLQSNVEFATKIVVACCVLHNICIQNGDIYTNVPDEVVDTEVLANVQLQFTNASAKRDAISRHLTPV